MHPWKGPSGGNASSSSESMESVSESAASPLALPLFAALYPDADILADLFGDPELGLAPVLEFEHVVV